MDPSSHAPGRKSLLPHSSSFSSGLARLRGGPKTTFASSSAPNIGHGAQTLGSVTFQPCSEIPEGSTVISDIPRSLSRTVSHQGLQGVENFVTSISRVFLEGHYAPVTRFLEGDQETLYDTTSMLMNTSTSLLREERRQPFMFACLNYFQHMKKASRHTPDPAKFYSAWGREISRFLPDFAREDKVDFESVLIKEFEALFSLTDKVLPWEVKLSRMRSFFLAIQNLPRGWDRFVAGSLMDFRRQLKESDVLDFDYAMMETFSQSPMLNDIDGVVEHLIWDADLLRIRSEAFSLIEHCLKIEIEQSSPEVVLRENNFRNKVLKCYFEKTCRPMIEEVFNSDEAQFSWGKLWEFLENRDLNSLAMAGSEGVSADQNRLARLVREWLNRVLFALSEKLVLDEPMLLALQKLQKEANARFEGKCPNLSYTYLFLRIINPTLLDGTSESESDATLRRQTRTFISKTIGKHSDNELFGVREAGKWSFLNDFVLKDEKILGLKNQIIDKLNF